MMFFVFFFSTKIERIEGKPHNNDRQRKKNNLNKMEKNQTIMKVFRIAYEYFIYLIISVRLIGEGGRGCNTV